MNEPRATPNRLYKYKKFDSSTLNLLITDCLYYADPTTFNDPLDSKPSVKCDLEIPELESVVRKLVQQRVRAEMSAAARSIKYKGPKTLDHIARQSLKEADQLIADIAYDATNPNYEVGDPHRFLLGSYLAKELLSRYNKGIVAFAERPDCPLMWSHYADQHRGICIGYSIPPGRALELNPVEYEGGRLVSASDISKMLNGDAAAQERVDRAVLFRKAAPWMYEQEWRLIGERGPQRSALELEEVIFGLRCDQAVSFAVVKSFETRKRKIDFSEIRDSTDTFELTKHPLDIEEALALWPTRSLSINETFEAMANAFDHQPTED